MSFSTSFQPIPHPQIIFALRLIVALVWLHEGLWQKLIVRAPHEVAVVEAVGQVGPIAPLQLLTLIGACETLLALVVLMFGALTFFLPTNC